MHVAKHVHVCVCPIHCYNLQMMVIEVYQFSIEHGIMLKLLLAKFEYILKSNSVVFGRVSSFNNHIQLDYHQKEACAGRMRVFAYFSVCAGGVEMRVNECL